jgi:hypothetical protein
VQTTNIPQLDKLRSIENSVLNQTDSLFNQTTSQPVETATPDTIG